MGQIHNREKLSTAALTAAAVASTTVKKPSILARLFATIASLDFGTVVMNIGSIVSLTGFMMSDVLHLRLLSICGSICGMTYNLTRSPPQINAVGWSVVFASTNVFKTIQLLYNRRAPRLTEEEHLLYNEHFKPMGVKPRQFKKLISSDSCKWKKYKDGDVIVNPGEPLEKVILVHRGEARCEDASKPVGTRRALKWKYKAGINGCCIGGTAIVDHEVLKKSYPNRIISCKSNDNEPLIHGADTITIEWDVYKLIKHMNDDKEVEAAILHLLYYELITHFRRERHEKLGRRGTMAIGVKLEIYKTKVEKCIKSAEKEKKEGEKPQLNPHDKKAIREFRMKERITPMQEAAILRSFGWTKEEWHDGMKH
eukprot:g6822.t1